MRSVKSSSLNYANENAELILHALLAAVSPVGARQSRLRFLGNKGESAMISHHKNVGAPAAAEFQQTSR